MNVAPSQTQSVKADDSIKPVVERSGTPGKAANKGLSPRSGRQLPQFQIIGKYHQPAIDLQSAITAPRAKRYSPRRILGAYAPALCHRPLRGLFSTSRL